MQHTIQAGIDFFFGGGGGEVKNVIEMLKLEILISLCPADRHDVALNRMNGH